MSARCFRPTATASLLLALMVPMAMSAQAAAPASDPEPQAGASSTATSTTSATASGAASGTPPGADMAEGHDGNADDAAGAGKGAAAVASPASASGTSPGASGDIGTSQGQGRFVLGEELPKPDHAKRSGKGAGDGGDGRDGQPAGEYPEMDWDRLIPADWEPLNEFKSLNFAGMSDSDPRAIAALRKLQKAWKNAPLNPAIQHERIRISGFIVPLDSSDSTTIEEFLLVPYFGACIHVPPPPSNQVIHVVPEKPLKGFQIMDPVTVSGVLTPSRTDTPLGSAGYEMSARSVTAYEEDMEDASPQHP